MIACQEAGLGQFQLHSVSRGREILKSHKLFFQSEPPVPNHLSSSGSSESLGSAGLVDKTEEGIRKGRDKRLPGVAGSTTAP